MGKAKKARPLHTNHHDRPASRSAGVKHRQHSQNATRPTSTAGKKASKSTQAPKPRVLFNSSDHVLLVGEGDFSFSLSLKIHHGIKQITATCYDSEEVLLEKYGPQARTSLEKLLSHTLSNDNVPIITSNLDGDTVEDEWLGLSPVMSDDQSSSDVSPNPSTAAVPAAKDIKVSVHYEIDATKLSTRHSRSIGSRARPRNKTWPYTKIVFNFPHVGGLSTDINRQVRANQELLVGFFKSAIPLLASPRNPCFHSSVAASDEEFDQPAQTVEKITMGQILVTLFEGEPYTLWNIRDLARHCGLRIVESFRFPWESFPGYRHARTMGEVKTGKDRSEVGKRRGAWRGEEREARCYVFEVKEEVQDLSSGTGGNTQVLGKRKGSGGQNADDSESDE